MKRVLSTIILSLNLVFCYSQSISGTVTDQNSNPLQGATISLEGTDYGVASSESGQFKILVNQGEYTINVSFIGFEIYSKDVIVAGTNDVDLGNIMLQPKSKVLDNLTITALMLEPKAPFAFLNVNAKKIETFNQGKDIPSLLSFTPSFVSSSDAGTGIGYSAMWIRGSDATRINVTLNGVPFNDSESSGTFWVNLPDIASSVHNIQLQRGLGTSSHGAGAFGATINLQTISVKKDPYASFSQSLGSFSTRKSTLRFGSGLINDVWSFEGRLSAISSDGYVDRASADLKSYYLQASYVKPKFQVDLVNFSGKEITYQAWNGVPQSRIEGNLEDMQLHSLNNGLSQEETENLLNSDRRYNFYTYDNQVDDYKQDHYQIHFNGELTSKLNAGVALHYTKGKGYFEEYRPNDSYANYGLNDPVIGMDTFANGDFIRRRWLDNDFYGVIANVENLVQKGLKFIIGIGYNSYKGDHFGEIIWSSINQGIGIRHPYYNGIGDKTDFNSYVKLKLDLADNLILYSDVQFRRIGYKISGMNNDLRDLDVSETYNFFNPKFGLSFYLTPKSRFYVSYGMGNKEPNRVDFVDANPETTPLSEKLKDLEIGYQYLTPDLDVSVNGYFMNYENQLILTGAINDVGSPIRENIEDSYRAGIELSANYFINEKIKFSSNLTVSQNKIEDFTETIYDYTNGFDIVTNEYEKTDISFSPSVIANAGILFKPIDDLELELNSKYVGDQFLDNTSNDNRKLGSYFVNDLRIGYSMKLDKINRVNFGLDIYNFLDHEYESNGYTFSYILGDQITENFYYPQAGTHFLGSITIQF